MPQQVLSLVRKTTILVVDIQNIVGDVVVADVDIRPAIVVDITYRKTEAKTFVGYACLEGNVGKGTVTVVFVEAIVVNG